MSNRSVRGRRSWQAFRRPSGVSCLIRATPHRLAPRDCGGRLAQNGFARTQPRQPRLIAPHESRCEPPTHRCRSWGEWGRHARFMLLALTDPHPRVAFLQCPSQRPASPAPFVPTSQCDDGRSPAEVAPRPQPAPKRDRRAARRGSIHHHEVGAEPHRTAPALLHLLPRILVLINFEPTPATRGVKRFLPSPTAAKGA
jgi:hypothetical protein